MVQEVLVLAQPGASPLWASSGCTVVPVAQGMPLVSRPRSAGDRSENQHGGTVTHDPELASWRRSPLYGPLPPVTQALLVGAGWCRGRSHWRELRCLPVGGQQLEHSPGWCSPWARRGQRRWRSLRGQSWSTSYRTKELHPGRPGAPSCGPPIPATPGKHCDVMSH